jgi:hypothetical protein
MSLDTELQRTFDTLTDRLRHEIARQLKETIDEVTVAARIDREAAIDDAVARTRSEAERDGATRLHEEIAAAEIRGHDRAEAQARELLAQWEQRAHDMVDAGVAASRDLLRSADLAASERLIDAVRALDRARSLGDILETLVACAAREAARAGLLLVSGGALRGWRFIGFGPAFDAASAIVVPLEESGIIAEAIRTDAACSPDPSGRLAAPAFAALARGRESLAVPVAMSGEVIAVLYADQGTADEEGALRPSAMTWADAIEVMARHAARCLEAATAIKAMRVLTERPDVPKRRSSPDAADVAPASQNDEDESARRYARLLMSEIKLYHEGEVLAGRREHDLATRLGAEIARARVLYEQRVPSSLRGNEDFFHEELVRTLANGDVSLLGHMTSET